MTSWEPQPDSVRSPEQLAPAPDGPSGNTVAPTLTLVHQSGSLVGQVSRLAPGHHAIGRHADSDVQYDHTVDFLVSTRHGRFLTDGAAWVIEDVGSTNGTWVDGSRIQRQLLQHGQTVVLGTPGSTGSASFQVDLFNRQSPATLTGRAALAPFAQEPPKSVEAVTTVCQHCGASNLASEAEVGSSVVCKQCGRLTPVRPKVVEPSLLVDHPDVSPIPYNATAAASDVRGEEDRPARPGANADRTPDTPREGLPAGGASDERPAAGPAIGDPSAPAHAAALNDTAALNDAAARTSPTAPSAGRQKPTTPFGGSMRSGDALPAADASRASTPAGSLRPHAAGLPKAIVPDDASFFGGILGNVKGTIHRMREKRDLARELGALQLRLPKDRTAADAACAALGRRIWESGATELTSLPSGVNLRPLDEKLADVEERRREADAKQITEHRQHEQWVADWKDRHAEAERLLAEAKQQRESAVARQAEARQKVVQAVAGRVSTLSELAEKMSALSAQSQTEPPSDFDARYDALIGEIRRRLGEVRMSPPGWAELVAERTAAGQAIVAADAALKEAGERKDASQIERRSADDGQTRRLRELTTTVNRLKSEGAQARQSHHRHFIAVGREAADAAAFAADLPELSQTRGALRQVRATEQEIREKERRLQEMA